MVICGNVLVSLVGRSAGREKEDLFKLHSITQFVGDDQVSMVNRVEGSAEYADPGHDVYTPSRSMLIRNLLRE